MDNLNVTNIVAQCVNACELAFEFKRNEIFGEGIMISFLIQVVLFSIFGVFLPAIIWLLNKYSAAKVAPSTILLRKIQTLVLETTGFFIISLFVAAISTSRQSSPPSILELTYISNLVDSQLFFISGMMYSQTADQNMNQTQVSELLRIYYYVLFMAQLATSRYISVPNKTMYKTLAKECHKQHQFINAISSVSDGASSGKWVGIGMAISVGFFFVVVFGVVYIKSVPPFLARPIKMVWRRMPSWLKKNGKIISDLFMVGTNASLIAAGFHQLQKLRKLVIQESEAQPAGEQTWGYGQTTAVLLWLPFCFGAIKEIIKYVTNPLQPENNQTETGHLDPGEAPPSSAADVKPPPYDYPQFTSASTSTPEWME